MSDVSKRKCDKETMTRKQAAGKAARLRRETFGRYTSYRCNKCKGYHVGHRR